MNGMPPNSTQMKEATPLIAPIDQSTVKRIVAGQAISDLASCVKELVDNALDAGATSIQGKVLLFSLLPNRRLLLFNMLC